MSKNPDMGHPELSVRQTWSTCPPRFIGQMWATPRVAKRSGDNDRAGLSALFLHLFSPTERPAPKTINQASLRSRYKPKNDQAGDCEKQKAI